MVNETCSNCFFGRLDSIGRIFCSLFSNNSDLSYKCEHWKIRNSESKVGINKSGYIYIFSNPDLEGLLKVGMTYKRPEARAKELSSTTGVSSRYEIEYFGRVDDRFLAERAAHSRLHNFHHKKEFFKVEIAIAIYCVETISCDIERIYIKPGNDKMVLKYALERDKAPYKNIEHDWKERERDLKNYYDEHIKVREWEEKIEEYIRKISGKEESIFNYKDLNEKLSTKKIKNDFIKDKNLQKQILLPSELAQIEQEYKKSSEKLIKKEMEIQKLKEELIKEKNKGFFKKLFS